MANKKINELDSRSSLSLSDLMAVGDPSTGYLYKTTISDLKTLTGAGVVSFNGRFGAVSPAEGDYSLTQLSDVIITTAANGDIIKYNGSNWVNVPMYSGTIAQYVDGTGAYQTFPTLLSSDRLITEVRNNTGATVTKGTVVYLNGSSGTLPTIAKAQANSEATSSSTYGVVQNDIANNANGYVVVIGNLTGLDTSAYTAGDILWLSPTTAGGVTTTKPVAPNNAVYVGIVTRSNNSAGTIEVKIQNGYELDELHNVLITSVANNQGLFWDSATSLWKNKSIATALGYTPANAATYVPYTGATTDLELGMRDLYVRNVYANGILRTDFSLLLKSGSTTTTTGYLALSAQKIDSISQINIVSDTDFRFSIAAPNTANYTYTFPASSGTVALTSDLSSYVPYSGATQNVNLGVYNIELGAVLTNKTANGGLLMKQNTTISAEVSGTNYTSIKPFDTRYLYFDFGQPSSYKSFRIDANGLTNATLRTYTIPDASGTIALTSDLTGGTVTSVGLSSSTSGVTIGSSPITTSGTITLSIATASGLQQGLLSSSDWTTFSSKQAALSGTGFVKISGSTISYDNSTYLTTSAASSTYLPLSGGTLSGPLNVNVNSGTGLNVATENVVFRASPTYGFPRQLVFSMGSGPTTTLEAKGFGGNYITDFNIKTYNASGTAFDVFFGTSAGDVGIGNTAPAAKLDVNGSFKSTSATFSGAINLTGTANTFQVASIFRNANRVFFGGDTGGYFFQNSSNTATTFFIGDNGNVGIGTSSPQSILHLESSSSNGVATRFTSTSANGRSYAIGSNFVTGTGEFSIYDYTAGSERLRITSSGALCINATTTIGTNSKLQVNGSDAGPTFKNSNSSQQSLLLWNAVSSGNNLFLEFGADTSISIKGSIDFNRAAGLVRYNVTSDYRLKTDFQDFNGSDLLSSIKVYDYQLKETGSRVYGVIAHELQEVVPYAVSGEKDGEKMQGVDYSKIVPILVKAIQEQQAQIETLKKQLN